MSRCLSYSASLHMRWLLNPLVRCTGVSLVTAVRQHTHRGGVDLSMPSPPRPKAYVPPEERDPEDESLLFLDGNTHPQRGLAPGQQLAPQHTSVPLRLQTYADADSARLQSTSVHAGRALQRGGPTVGGEDYAREVPLGLASPRPSDGSPTLPHDRRNSLRELQTDLKQLEYCQGNPEYPKMLDAFRKKYDSPSSEKDCKLSDTSSQGFRGYTPLEVEQGLESQPVDFHRASAGLQAKMSVGPFGYHPVTVLQQQGVMRFQGYAFPPTVELGKLKDLDAAQALQDDLRRRQKGGALAKVRRKVNALFGRKDPGGNYLATSHVGPLEDTHFLYLTLGVDAVQRRQLRLMLTDFDYSDRSTTFHILMSYPYADWLHAFYMVLVGWCLYQLQVRYCAYEFYDEYLGLDLRQVPRIERPFLMGLTVVMMVFLFFQPLLIGSIATNRAYRIMMRRPLGPP